MIRRARAKLQATVVGLATLVAGGLFALHPGSVTALVGAIAVASAGLIAAGVAEPASSLCLLALIVEFSLCLSHLDVAARTACALVVAAALYALHTAAELLALIERDSEVDRRVLTRAAGRVAIVSGAGVLVGASMLALAKHPNPAWTSVAGIVVAAVIAWVLLVVLKRRTLGEARSRIAFRESVRGRSGTR